MELSPLPALHHNQLFVNENALLCRHLALPFFFFFTKAAYIVHSSCTLILDCRVSFLSNQTLEASTLGEEEAGSQLPSGSYVNCYYHSMK